MTYQVIKGDTFIIKIIEFILLNVKILGKIIKIDKLSFRLKR